MIPGTGIMLNNFLGEEDIYRPSEHHSPGDRMRTSTAEHDCDSWSLRITSVSSRCISRLIGRNRAGLKKDPEKWQ